MKIGALVYNVKKMGNCIRHKASRLGNIPNSAKISVSAVKIDLEGFENARSLRGRKFLACASEASISEGSLFRKV